MKKIKYLLIAIIIFLFISILSYKIISFKKDINYLSDNSLAIMVETEEGKYERYTGNNWPIDNYYFSNSECDNNSKVKWNYETNSVVLTSNKSDNCTLYFDKKENDFSFTGGIQEFVAPVTGTYKLEVWGAQGGSDSTRDTKDGGLGGYSSGEIFLNKGEKLYVVVGGEGSNSFENNVAKGGYNGGGDGLFLSGQYGCGGGGASHIAKVSGELSTLENNQSDILIVAGGGGGNGHTANDPYSPNGGAGGGLIGEDGINGTGYTDYLGHGGTQSEPGTCPVGTNNDCGTFGQGGSNTSTYIGGAGGGGGFYGGSQSSRGHAGAGGGSGYIGNPLLINGETIAGNSEMPSPTGETETGHSGNGYAKITLINQAINFNYVEDIQNFIVPKTGTYKLEVWGAQGGTILIKNTKNGGLGGYSSGEVFLSKGEILYVVVGGQGSSVNENDIYKGGYNGGGDGKNLNNQYGLGGGGATHIAKKTGILSSLETNQSDILIVAGGGGGNGTANNTDYSPDGGVGGGLNGGDGFNGTGLSNFLGHGGSQTKQGSCPSETSGNCGSFGHGGNNTSEVIGGAGGGGGFYGGSQSSRGHAGGGGGSGYIGNPILINGKTIAGNESFPSPSGGTETGHSGNGFARITLLSES